VDEHERGEEEVEEVNPSSSKRWQIRLTPTAELKVAKKVG
jgi:hypothetical protein